MRFKNCTLSNEVNHAIYVVERLLEPNSSMIKALQSKADWRFNSGSSGEVIVKLLEERKPISIYTYKSWNPFTKAVGYFDGKAIYLSVKALESFDFSQVCGLILHEYAHYCGFNHANNFKNKEKCLFSVPYYLSDNCTKWV